MKNNYVLVDYENVQPKDLVGLNEHLFKIMVFVGANQTKLPFELASTLQALGRQAEYVKIDGNGRNALDFHIAFYIGKLAESDPNAYFHIISTDSGFDPLIKHLRANKIFAQREKSLSEVPYVQISKSTSKDEKIDAIVKSLAGRGHARPRKIKTLANTINALFLKTLDEPDLQNLIAELSKRKYISVDNESVSYNPPIIQT